MASIVMLFASFTSAYMVRKSAGEWLAFQLPNIFWYSTFVIFFSSITMHLAYWAAQRNKTSLLKYFTLSTFLLGVGFTVMQYMGWQILTQQGIVLSSNPAASFVYVISGAHVLHVIGGFVFLLFLVVQSWRHKIDAGNTLSTELCMTYWHFVDGLWIYLFFFLLLTR
jgi:cytochrome c oxidase subunit 3